MCACYQTYCACYELTTRQLPCVVVIGGACDWPPVLCVLILQCMQSMRDWELLVSPVDRRLRSIA